MSKDKETFKYEPHNFSKKMLNYQYCVHCGLVTLKINLQSGVYNKDVIIKIIQVINIRGFNIQSCLINSLDNTF